MSLSAAPSRAGYAAGCLVMIVGVALGAAAVVLVLPRAFDELTRLEMPGSHEMRFDEAGTYYIYHERRGVVDGRVYAGDGQFSGLWLTVHRPDGTELFVEPPGAAMSYATGERAGEAIATFEIEEPGTYRVGARYDKPGGAPLLMAVGPSIMGGLFGAIASVIGSVLAGLSLGSAVWLRTFMRRAAAAQEPSAET